MFVLTTPNPTMINPTRNRPLQLAAIAAIIGLTTNLSAQTWNQTAGGNYDWNDSANWTGVFPNAAGATANVNNDILADQTLRLNVPITVGILNYGDSGAGAFAFNIQAFSGSLTFDSGVIGTAAQLNLSSVGTPINSISAPVTLTSDLIVNMGGVDAANNQRLTFSNNAINMSGRNLTFTGGFFGSGFSAIQINGTNTLVGDANSTITNNSHGALSIGGRQENYFGRYIANGMAAGSNTMALGLGQNGALPNASEFVINGHLSAGITQNGGGIQVGQGSTSATNPGQRLTQNTITFNGGTLIAGGQALNAAELNRVILDNVATVNLNSGYSRLVVASAGSATTTTSRVLAVGDLNRSAGSTILVAGSQFNNPSALNATTLSITNGASYLIGGGGTTGNTDISIIPWMVATNANTSAASSDTFATYDGNGIRALDTTTEYATTLAAGATRNVSVGNMAIADPDVSLTVNALRVTNGGSTNIGTAKTLNVTSGGLIFASNNGGIGVAGDAAAGTLNFGAAEGVVWSNGSNTNRIGAAIAGSGGFTKTGTGTLIISGANLFSGDTHVSSGTLQVESTSNLGVTGDVTIANGATLSLFNDISISDTATLTLQNFGLTNGMVTLATGLNETVGALYLGDTGYFSGTFGAVGSGASFESNQWFGGSGIITVIPEPATWLLLAGAGTFLITRRRRHA